MRRVLLLALVLAAPLARGATPSAERLRLGKRYYLEFCAKCHGADGRGDNKLARSLVPPPPDLRLLAALGPFPTERVLASIDGRSHLPAHSTRQMPVFGDALASGSGGRGQEADVKARLSLLVTYVASLQSTATSTTP